jgi:hypothetical protein
MRIKQLFFISAITTVLNGCLLWNVALFADEHRFMNTGASVVIYKDTLVFGTNFISRDKGGYIAIYERKNQNWERKAVFTGKKLAPGYQFPMYSDNRSFIAVSDTVIAVVAGPRGWYWPNEKEPYKAVVIFAKQNESWNYIDTIYGDDWVGLALRPGQGFASGISVNKNKIAILVEGSDTYYDFSGEKNFYAESLKRYLYKDIKSSIQIFSVENGSISQNEIFNVPVRTSPGYGGIIQLLDDKILITSSEFKYKDNYETKIGDGQASIYDYSNGLCKLNMVFNNRNNIYMEDAKYMEFAAIKDDTICIAFSDKIYILKNNNGSWDLCKIIDIPKNRDLEPVEGFAFDDNILVVANTKYIYVYRCDYTGEWNLTDTIAREALSKHVIHSLSISLSNHTIVLGINNVHLLAQLGDDIASRPYSPFFFPENPGKVCIIELLPDKGYKIEDIIVRDYTLFGKVRFKSEFK